MITQLFTKSRDGGPSSPVDGYFLIEMKSLFSIALLKFNKGGREEFHTHAFDAFTWFLSGEMIEEDFNGTAYKYQRSWMPKFTRISKNHRVKAARDSWCLTIRGPWQDTWTEDSIVDNTTTTFTHNRVILGKRKNFSA